MASVFQFGHERGKRGAPWWIEYIDEFGKRRRKKGYTRERETRELAADIEREVRQKKLMPADPVRDALREHRGKPIDAHLDDYELHLGMGSRTSKHQTLTMSRIRKVVAEAAIRTLDDLQPDKVDAYLHKLSLMEKPRKKTEPRQKLYGPRTLNHYVQALQGWCRWLVTNRRLSASPLESLTTYNAAEDVRHNRRALIVEEVTQLIASARGSNQTIQGMDPESRARLYTMAFLTGLRRKELASLTPSSFDLKSSPPTLTVAAACSKHRRTDVLPLHAELAESLPAWLSGLQPNDFLFPQLAHRKTWLMVKKDLERVGIPYVTPAGIADFHASGRHTFVTQLLRSGVSLTQARQLARHDDIKMTMQYTHIDLADQAEALKSLPGTAPSSQQIISTSAQPTSDDVSRHATAWHKTDNDGEFESPEKTSGFDASWHNETGDGDDCHHPLKSGGGGNRTRVPRYLYGGFYVRSRRF